MPPQCTEAQRHVRAAGYKVRTPDQLLDAAGAILAREFGLKRTILDRAYGKPRQPVEGEMLHGISAELAQLMEDNADKPANFLGFGTDEDDDGDDPVR